MKERLLVLLLFGCAISAHAELIPVTLLQINDVYEITAGNGGKEGGIARVATIRNQLFARNPRTYTVLAGDFFSPSALGTARVSGVPLAGRQMVDMLNQIPLAFATFGNHEFDVKQDQFLQRMEESRFIWFSSNVRDASGELFPYVRDTYVLSAKGSAGEVVRIGFLGVTLPSNPKDYVQYLDVISSAKRAAADLKTKADIVVAVTHLAIDQDQKLAADVPEIDLILGGHEHDNVQQWRGEDFTPIFKADANARSVYVHEIRFDSETRRWTIQSRIERLDERIPEDKDLARRAEAWVDRAFRAFAEQGFDARSVVAVAAQSLDGRESSVRNRPTNLTAVIARAILSEVEGADLSFFNSGSIRIDDQLPPGQITQYDVIRILPFGGNILGVEMEGSLLVRVLDQGMANREKGGFLQTANTTRSENGWMVNGQAIDLQRVYKVATTDFLMSGKEQGLEFLTPQASGVRSVKEGKDIRFAVIRELQKASPAN